MNTRDSCYFFNFGMIVTGKSEREHLPRLFRSLSAAGVSAFKVFRFIGQRSPIVSKARRLKMLGEGKAIPSMDEQEIGLPARRFLSDDKCNFLILIDDLEHTRRKQARQILERYRTSFDAVLKDEQKSRASVHFLVNMLEAYYFADSKAVNTALNPDPPLEDWPEDVETIRNPKSKMKQIFQGFNEVDDGGAILAHIDLEHILSHPDRCAWLRTLVSWCVSILKQYPDSKYYDSLEFSKKYRLKEGVFSGVTSGQ